jgi:CDP-ribitol ribitolphosphotransferase
MIQTSDAVSAVFTDHPRGGASMRFLIAAATLCARLLYALFKLLAPVRNRVVFLSRQSDAPSRDFVFLAEALREQDPTLEIVVRCRMVGGGWAQRTAAAVATVGQMWHLASSRACVVDGYVIPVSILDHRPGLFVVQMWHALGAIKRFGYQTVGSPGGHAESLARAMRMHRNYDLVLCGGPATIPVFAEAFRVDPSIVAADGLPRMDYLRDGAEALKAGSLSPGAARLREGCPVLGDESRTVVLYAPTLRPGGADRYRDVTGAFAGERYTLIVKPHPLESARFEGDNVVDASGVDVLDILPMCSAVITDYSAVAFEAAVIDVPVHFYVYDIEEYRRAFGLNVDPLIEFPQAASRSILDVAGRIEAGDTHPEVTALLKERYASAPQGCARRVAARILTAMKEH